MNQHQEHHAKTKKPPWLKQRISNNAIYREVTALLNDQRLHTVCQKAQCPNLWQCFSQKTATFMIMGDRCTRNCRFCNVAQGPPNPPDPDEPARVAAAVQHLKLSYVVITSVTRDDLPDGGAAVFASTVKEIRKIRPDVRIEVLIPDFQGDPDAVRTVVDIRPAVLNHNMETVSRLYDTVRPEARYHRSLELLKQARDDDALLLTKSGLMLGLGESSEEIRKTLQDLLEADCRLLTLGQYLQPTPDHLPVQRFVHPDEFDGWKETALKMGFGGVVSGPLVRSSYQAEKLYRGVSI